jgi:hypothetical protein
MIARNDHDDPAGCRDSWLAIVARLRPDIIVIAHDDADVPPRPSWSSGTIEREWRAMYA